MQTNNEEIQRIAEADSDEAKAVVEFVTNAELQSASDLQTFVQWIAEIKTKAKEIDEKRKSFTKQLRNVIKDIDGFFKPALDALTIAENSAKSRIKSFTAQSEIKQAELLKSMDVKLNPKERKAIMKKAEALEVPKIPGLQIRKTWNGEITDPIKLMDWAIENDAKEILRLDEKALVDLTKQLDRDPQIPGWKPYQDRTIVVTPSKV